MARKAAAQPDPKVEEQKMEEPVPTEDIEINLDAAPEEVVEPTPAEPAQEPAPTPSAEDDEKVALRQRLQEMERAEQLTRQQAEDAQRQLVEAQRGQRQSQWQAWEARKTEVINRAGAAQSVIDAATQEIEAASANGDKKAEIEAFRRLSRAEAQLERAEAEKAQMEEREAQWKQQQQRQPQRQPQQQPLQRPPTVEQIIAGAAIPDVAKEWLRKHPDYISDQAKNAQLIKMHNVAEYQARGEFTPAYFERMEVLLGLKQERQHPTNGGGPEQQRPAPVRSAPVSAPPTREAPSMTTGRAPEPTQVRLTKEQQEIAYATRPREDMTRNQSYELYARNIMKMRKMKKDGEIE